MLLEYLRTRCPHRTQQMLIALTQLRHRCKVTHQQQAPPMLKLDAQEALLVLQEPTFHQVVQVTLEQVRMLRTRGES